MKYIELKCRIQPGIYTDMVIASLSEIGFEGFVENEDHLLAYILETDYDENKLAGLAIWELDDLVCTFIPTIVPDENWNQLWEKSYEPVIIAGRCGIRADFHTPFTHLDFDIIINPRMSFGTAHHETTHLMLEKMLAIKMNGLSVLDMGCGTGVLAILASMQGASRVMAIDNDSNAVENASENALLNRQNAVKVCPGDIRTIKGLFFDIILANINRNVLLNDMQFYADSLNQKGLLLLSGFYQKDIELITARAKECSMNLMDHSLKNDWAVLTLRKK